MITFNQNIFIAFVLSIKVKRLNDHNKNLIHIVNSLRNKDEYLQNVCTQRMAHAFQLYIASGLIELKQAEVNFLRLTQM